MLGRASQLSLLQHLEIGHKGLPILCDSRPAGTPALQWNSALCSVGVLAGIRTTDHELTKIGLLASTGASDREDLIRQYRSVHPPGLISY